MHRSQPYPALSDAAHVLSEQLKDHLERLAELLEPVAERLDSQFRRRIGAWRLEARCLKAVCAITPGSICRLLAGCAPLARVFEEIEYQGRRLAKLDLKPRDVLRALLEYDKVLAPALRRLAPGQQADLRWVQEQLHFCTVLILNQAYYSVRETESRTFYDLARRELEEDSLDQLLHGVAEVLRIYTKAAEAKITLCPPEASMQGARVTDRATALHPDWADRYARVWSVPLAGRHRVEGVMQFAFTTDYGWLPREQELLKRAAERCVALIERSRMLDDLAGQRDQIRRLAGHMMQVEEAERRRISRELHDEAGQSLLCIRLQLEMLENELPAACASQRNKLRETREVTERTIVEMRRLISALSPAVLEQLGLAAALRQLTSRLRQLTHCQVTLKLGRLQSIPTETAAVAYRVIQECCNNISKHALARNINISVRTTDSKVWLQVEDDGAGFDVEEAFAKPGAYGLSGIRERVAVLGGSCVVNSQVADNGNRSSGTQLRVELPLAAGRRDAGKVGAAGREQVARRR